MKILRAARLNLAHWRIDPKYPTVLFYLAFYMWFLVHGYAAYGEDLGSTVQPWLFPFLPGNWNWCIPILFSYVLLISDAPFRSRQQQFILQRIGKRAWAGGQVLYLLFTSLIFTAALWLLSWLFLIPNLEWGSDWGPVLTTAAIGKDQLAYSQLFLDYNTMKGVTPMEATAWVFSVMTAVCFFLGLVMMACNLWCKRGVGTVTVCTFVIFPWVLDIFASSPGMFKMLLWVSPVSWMDRSMMGHTNQNLPSFAYGLGMSVFLCVLLAAILIGTIHKCNLETEKE